MTTHPTQYSQSLLEIIAPELDEKIHDPFAGTGIRLGKLCDELGKTFSGTDIEDWGGDPRVKRGDSTQLSSYPEGSYQIVTSPVYPNGMADHFKPKDTSRRRTYRVGLGKSLQENNAGRYSVRAGSKAADKYWEINKEAIICWATLGWSGFVNVSDFIHKGEVYPLVGMWRDLLAQQGFYVEQYATVLTPRYRLGTNRSKRVPYEAWLEFYPDPI